MFTYLKNLAVKAFMAVKEFFFGKKKEETKPSKTESMLDELKDLESQNIHDELRSDNESVVAVAVSKITRMHILYTRLTIKGVEFDKEFYAIHIQGLMLTATTAGAIEEDYFSDWEF